MVDFSARASSRSIFNLRDKAPKYFLWTSWWISLSMLKYCGLRFPSVRKLWPIPFTWKAMWLLCSTLNEQSVSRDTASQLQEELPTTKWWAPRVSSSRRNCSKVWEGREDHCGSINTPVASLFRRENGIGMNSLIMLQDLFVSKDKNWECYFKPKVSPEHHWCKNVISQFSDKALIIAPMRMWAQGAGVDSNCTGLNSNFKSCSSVWSLVPSSLKWE